MNCYRARNGISFMANDSLTRESTGQCPLAVNNY